MANPNAPFGFKPIKALSGSSLQVNYYKVSSSATRIGKGDLVELNSSGFIQRSTSATSVGPWVGVSLADSGTIIAGGIARHPVCDDPSAVYEVQGATAALATTDLGTIVKANCGTAPNSSTGLSKNVLTSTAATASNGVRLVRFVADPNNEVAASARLEVRLNSSTSVPGTAGV
jgi:hypothetical protein